MNYYGDPHDMAVMIAVIRRTRKGLSPAHADKNHLHHRLMRQGVWTLNARTVHESTQTLPNHTSMVTGRPVTATGGHPGNDRQHAAIRRWIAPRDVQPGREWRPSIIEAIERCQIIS